MYVRTSLESIQCHIERRALVQTEWDASAYASAISKGTLSEVDMDIMFPSPTFGQCHRPATVVDSAGRIILWYLPEVLSSAHQVPNILHDVCMG